MSKNNSFFQDVDRSFFWTFSFIVLLYSAAILITVVAPWFVDPVWKQPSSYYQVQMYEVADPNFFISSEATGIKKLEYIHRLKNNYTLLSFEESKTTRILVSTELEKYVTRVDDKIHKLTSRLLLLRNPVDTKKADEFRKKLQTDQKELIDYKIVELYDPGIQEAFSLSHSDGIIEDFVDQNFVVIDEEVKQPWHKDPGVIFVKNPEEYRLKEIGGVWKYDAEGRPIKNIEELTGKEFGFRSRRELIAMGEQVYAHEGCWYCHTDQTRTLVQDTVLNGAEFYPAPPSSPSEYIYQKVTFPGTRRIGPDMSRVGIKRPSRDWHKSHFWSPKTASAGSIMPSFQHFFDFDPRGTSKTNAGVPNYKFEAIYQYLMTKGTRITPPTEAWWLGKDPVNTLKIIEKRI